MPTLSDPKIVTAADYADQLLEALGIDNKITMVRRIVIDVTVGEPVRVYLEAFGTNRLLTVKLPVTDIEIVTNGKANDCDG